MFIHNCQSKGLCMARWLKSFFLFAILVCGIQLRADFLLTGDSSAAVGKSFSFTISKHVLGSDDTLFVARNDASVGAGTSDDIRKYTISAVKEGYTTFLPLTPATVILNGVSSSTNPLIGEKISVMGLFRSGPIVVRNDTLQHLYWIASGARTVDVEVLKIENVKDAQGATNSDGSTTAGIIGLTASHNHIFAAVKKNGDNFGVSGAGIAMIQQSGASLSQMAAVTGDTGIKALGLDPSSSVLKIGSNLASINGSVIDMHWDEILQRLYI